MAIATHADTEKMVNKIIFMLLFSECINIAQLSCMQSNNQYSFSCTIIESNILQIVIITSNHGNTYKMTNERSFLQNIDIHNKILLCQSYHPLDEKMDSNFQNMLIVN